MFAKNVIYIRIFTYFAKHEVKLHRKIRNIKFINYPNLNRRLNCVVFVECGSCFVGALLPVFA